MCVMNPEAALCSLFYSSEIILFQRYEINAGSLLYFTLIEFTN